MNLFKGAIYLFSCQQILCAQIVDSQWSSSPCVGPPQVIYIFEMADLEAVSPTENDETWPDAFSNILINDEYMSMCSQFQNVPNDGCCRVAYPEFDVGYQGIIAQPLDSIDIQNSIPIDSNGQEYCHLTALDDISLHGFQELYILISECANGIVCGENWIALHDTGDCEGSNELFEYNFKEEHRNTTIGDFAASKGEILGTLPIKFVSHFPSSMQHGETKSPWEIFAVLSLIASHLMIFYVIGVAAHSFSKNRKRTYLMTVIGMLLFLIDCELAAFDFYVKFEDLESYSRFFQFFSLADAAATLFMVSQTAEVIVKSFGLSSTFIFTGIFLTHTALSGGIYIAYLYSMAIEPYFSIYTIWFGIGGPLWYLFMMVFDFLPIAYLVHSIIKSNAAASQKGVFTEAYRVLKRDRNILLLVGANLLTAFAYLITQIAYGNYPIIFKVDIDAYAASVSFQMLFLAVHGVSQCLALDYIRTIWKHQGTFLATTRQKNLATSPEVEILQLSSAKRLVSHVSEIRTVQMDEKYGNHT